MRSGDPIATGALSFAPGLAGPADKEVSNDHSSHSQASVVPDETGATAVEYALMVMLIALVIIAAVTLLGTNLSTFFTSAATSI